MRLRPYRPGDFDHIRNWISDRRSHDLWCAGRLSYPVERDAFHRFLADNAGQRGECGLVFAEDDGAPVGFCSFAIDDGDNSGFLKLIIVDGSRRGQGLGGQMLGRVLKYADDIAGVEKVRLVVFDANPAARRCYEKAGFCCEKELPEAFESGAEKWRRFLMAADTTQTK